MSKQVEFYFDFGSPTAYLAFTQLPQIAERTGATLVYRPALLGGIFKTVGNRPPVSVPAKGVWLWQDISRFAKRYGVTLNMNPYFPVNTLHLMRGAMVAQGEDYFESYCQTMFDAVWVHELDMSNPEVIIGVLKEAGLPAQTLVTETQNPVVKEKLIAATAEAVERGLFGMPTMFVGEEMFFGQDRLDFVEEALRR